MTKIQNQTPKLRRVYMYGAMADKFGSEPLELAVKNTAAVWLALKSIHKDWRQYTIDNPTVAIVLSQDNKENPRVVEAEMINMDFGNATEVHIVPAAEGDWTAVAAYFAKLTLAKIVTSILINMAVNFVLGQIAQALAPSPDTGAGSPNQVAENKSFLFNGPINVQEQGGPVQVVYGIFLTGSTVVSSAIEVEQLLNTPEKSVPPSNGGGSPQPVSPPAVSWQWSGQ